MHELAVLVLHVIFSHHHILNSDAVAALHIDAGFVGDVHAFLDDGLRPVLHILPAQVLRPLVHVQDVAHSMAGAAFVVHSDVPDRLAGTYVQVAARAAVEPPGVGHLQHSRSHHGVMHLDFIGNGPQHNGSGHVRGGPQILAAGVHQEQPLRLQHRRALRGGRVVHHGGVGLVACDGGERQAYAFRNLPAQFLQLVRGRDLRDFRLSDIILQPVDELCQRHAVL